MSDPTVSEALVAPGSARGADAGPVVHHDPDDPVVVEPDGGPRGDVPIGEGATPAAVVLAGLSVPGLDLDEARHLVSVRAGRRIRRRRAVLGSTCAVVAVGLALLLWPQPDPQEINADGSRSTTTSSTIAPVASELPTVTTVPVTTVAPSTSVAPTVTTVPLTTLPPSTTLPPNQALTATARLLDGSGTPITDAVVGRTVAVEVTWSDPDVVDAASVGAIAEFGDPAVTLPISASSRPPCDAPGRGADGVITVPFRYATPTPSGSSTVIRVEVTACDGSGAYGERRRLDVPVRVLAAGSGTRVLVVGGGDGRSPDAGEVLDATGAVLSPPRVPELAQVLPDGSTRATVATVPATYGGGLWLRWGAACQATQSPVVAGAETVTSVLAPGLVACPT